jgi:hypothetical protein
MTKLPSPSPTAHYIQPITAAAAAAAHILHLFWVANESEDGEVVVVVVVSTKCYQNLINHNWTIGHFLSRREREGGGNNRKSMSKKKTGFAHVMSQICIVC